MPNLLGLSYKDCYNILNLMGVNYKIEGNGYVVNQSIPENMIIPLDNELIITLGK